MNKHRLAADMHRAGSLVAERRASSEKRILLIGHLDTFFSKKSGIKNFF